MIKKISVIFILYVVFLFVGVFSCDISEPCGPFPDKFKVVGLEYNVLKVEYSQGTGFEIKEFKINIDTLNHTNFALFVRSMKETYFSMLNRAKSFSLIQPIYACTPIDPTTDEKIENIEIFCDKDWNDDFPAGTNLAPIIDVVIYDQVNNIYNQLYTLEAFLAKNPDAVDQMTFMINTPPSETDKYTFIVKYYQQGIDEDYFEFETLQVNIRSNVKL